MSNPITREEILLKSIANGENSKLTPVTREEQYLSFVAGEGNTYPLSPITRKEELLDKIAKSGIQGGGSGVNIQSLEVTENGEYTAPEGVAYSRVTVQVKSQDGSNKLSQIIDGSVEEITAEDLDGVTKVCNYAFYSREFLARVVIPDSVKSIGSNAFYYCISLNSVSIGDGVTDIGHSAFSWCSSLTSVVIPDRVTRISDYAFAWCSSMTSVKIGKSVTSIGDQAFYSCTSMQYYDFSSHNSVPTLEHTNAFGNIPENCEIRVPSSLVDAWKSATNWSEYADKIVGV